MAVDVRIKPKGIFKKRIDINEIIKCSSLAYGVSDENYRLVENETESHTLLYNQEYLARGIDVSFDQNDVLLQLSLPTGIDEIRCFYNLIEKIAKLLKKVEIYRDDQLYDSNLIDYYIDLDIDGCNRGLEVIEAEIEDDKTNHLQIFGIYHPLSVGYHEIKSFKGNIDDFAKWMHQLQIMDVYFAVPKVFKINNMITGIYIIGADIESVVPTKPYIIMNQIKGIERWFVVLGENKNILYDDFINNVETRYYDANHVIVNISEEKIVDLIDKFGKDL